MFKKSPRFSFVFYLFFFCIMSFSVNMALATPSITGISGSLVHNQSVTISGSGFGVKSPVAPIVWNNHESCTADSNANTCGTYAYDDNSNLNVYIKTGKAYGKGTKSLKVDYATGLDSKSPRLVAKYFSPGLLELYQTYHMYYTRYAGSGSAQFIFKQGRGGSLPTYTGSPRFYETIRPASNLICTGTNGDVGFVTDSGTTYSTANYPAGADGNQWNRIEYHYKLSNPAGTSNGAYEVWTNSVKDVNLTNAVTRTSAESSSLIDYVFAISANESYGTSNAYYLWIGDMYVDDTVARVEICSGSTWNSRGNCEIQIPHDTWSDTTIQVAVNQGAIPDSQKGYLYVVDSTGVANSNGYGITFGTSDTSSVPAPPTNLRVVSY